MSKLNLNNFEQVIGQFPDWYRMKKGTWSEHSIILRYGEEEKDFIEIGLYREPNDYDIEINGKYTLQGFDGDDVIFCHTVEGLDAMKFIIDRKELI